MRIYFALFAVIVFIDQLTKHWIVSNFSLYDALVVIPDFFNLVYVTNKGAAFSLFASVESPIRHYFFVSVNLSAAVGLTIAAYKMRQKHKMYVLSFSLIAAGALGNLIDRIRFGAVVDFLDFYFGSYHWPAFNVADSAIFVGVGLLFIINIIDTHKESRRK